jgi:alpha-methylacyl-CoA racemase
MISKCTGGRSGMTTIIRRRSMGEGPLRGVRLVELAGIGPAPFAAFMLADMGAEIVRVDRLVGPSSAVAAPTTDPMLRSRRSITVDLKSPAGAALVLELVRHADGFFEGFRPGVAERLGLGPDDCLGANPKLVYGRMTGWGQDGTYAGNAGHDINYIALAGALYNFRRAGQSPVPPMNLVGDFGGGGMLLAFGMVCALFEAARSGRGQVIDAAMVDGTASLLAMATAMMAAGQLGPAGTNILDTGAHFYDVYETADGRHVSIGSIEPQFYARLLEVLGLADEPDLPGQMDRAQWPTMRERLAACFAERTLAAWDELLSPETELCYAPILTVEEAAAHPHLAHRGTYVRPDGILQPAPAPRFSRTPGAIQRPPAQPGEHGAEILREWLGMPTNEFARLRSDGVVG